MAAVEEVTNTEQPTTRDSAESKAVKDIQAEQPNIVTTPIESKPAEVTPGKTDEKRPNEDTADVVPVLIGSNHKASVEHASTSQA